MWLTRSLRGATGSLATSPQLICSPGSQAVSLLTGRTAATPNPLITSQRLRQRCTNPVIAMAKPRKKAPTKTVKITCANCRAFLYKYRKGGNGALVKCFHERIVEDATGGKLECPGCGQAFARETMIRGAPANKMIGGKVNMQK